MHEIFQQTDYKRPSDVAGLVKISTVFGPRFAAPHELRRKSDTVAVAEGTANGRYIHRCYIVGTWPQAPSAVNARRQEILAGLGVAALAAGSAKASGSRGN